MVQDMISAVEAKMQINTQALDKCQQQVLKILQQTHHSFSDLQICSTQKQKKQDLQICPAQKQNKLVLRESHHLRPNKTAATEFEYPPRDQIRYDNPVVGFKTGKWPSYGYCGWNLIMKDGTKSDNRQDVRAVETVLE